MFKNKKFCLQTLIARIFGTVKGQEMLLGVNFNAETRAYSSVRSPFTYAKQGILLLTHAPFDPTYAGNKNGNNYSTYPQVHSQHTTLTLRCADMQKPYRC